MEFSGVSYIDKKHNKSRKFIFFIFVLLIIIVTAVLGLAVGSAFTVIYPEKVVVESFSSNIVPSYQDISIKIEEDSIILKGWLFYKKDNTKILILSHDYGKNRMQFGVDTIDLIKFYINNGFDVLTFDYRNHGDSEGKATSMGNNERKDLGAVVDYVVKKEYEEINILGFGMGANIAIDLLENRKDINAVIADTPANSYDEIIDLHVNRTNLNKMFPMNILVPKFIKLFTGTTQSHWNQYENILDIIPGKIMLIQGENDEVINHSISKKYFTKITEEYPYNAVYLEMPKAGYLESYVVDHEKYLNETLAFLNNN